MIFLKCLKICFQNGIYQSINVAIPFNQPCEKEIQPGSDAPAGQRQSRGG